MVRSVSRSGVPAARTLANTRSASRLGLILRGQKVLLSTHLAELYGVPPKALVQAVKRNAERFPPDFMFQLSGEEFADLKSQIVTSSWGGQRRAAPYAFAEQGVAMLSTVLRSRRAVLVNIEITRTFVRLRQLMPSDRIPLVEMSRASRARVIVCAPAYQRAQGFRATLNASVRISVPMITVAYRAVFVLLMVVGVAPSAFAPVVGAHAQGFSRADADAMQAKLMLMQEAAESPRASGALPSSTSLSESEINAYFEHYGESFLPDGIAKPRATLLDGGRLVARAIVDFNTVRLVRERGVFDPLAYLNRSVEVVATGTIAGNNGEGVIRFESATVARIPVPKQVVQELLRFYTQTAERPGGFQFDEPFAMPAQVQSVSGVRGSVTVTQ